MPEIKPSPELIAIAARWGNAIDERDGETLRNLLSTSEYLRYIGSDAGELWGGKVLRDGIADHFGEVPEFEAGDQKIEAFECGTMGWAYWIVPLRFAGTKDFVDHRITAVFTLEHGAWKFVHLHMSNPISNVEKMGVDNTALDNLVAAAKAGFERPGKAGSATVMFTDIADSSAIVEAVGDRRWTAMIQSHVELIKTAVDAENGRLIKSLGDGTMSTFTSAGAAMRAALGIQESLAAQAEEPRLQARIGLHTGDVVETGDDFFGTVVNKAARVASVAVGGEIRVSDATKIMVGQTKDFVFDNPMRVKLKGLEGEHALYRLSNCER